MTLAAGSPHGGVQVERAVSYDLGQMLDIYRPLSTETASAPQPIVLLWHGVGPDERDVLESLAHATAALGLAVVVPDCGPMHRTAGAPTCSAR